MLCGRRVALDDERSYPEPSEQDCCAEADGSCTDNEDLRIWLACAPQLRAAIFWRSKAIGSQRRYRAQDNHPTIIRHHRRSVVLRQLQSKLGDGRKPRSRYFSVICHCPTGELPNLKPGGGVGPASASGYPCWGWALRLNADLYRIDRYLVFAGDPAAAWTLTLVAASAIARKRRGAFGCTQMAVAATR
jgi:hypothetical protein